jgi:hypothetical protein
VTVGDKYSISGKLIAPSVPNTHWNDNAALGVIIGEAFVFAIIGSIESLMTQMLLDKETRSKSNMNREMFVFGVGNVITGFMGGMAGCALVGPTILNIVSKGGSRRVSGTVNGLITLIAIYAAGPIIGLIPLGVLSGVTFVICIRTFDWNTFWLMYHIPVGDSLVIVTVTVVTIFTDLAIGVGAGLGMAFLWHAFATRKNVMYLIDPVVAEYEASPEGAAGAHHAAITARTVHFSGMLYFASAPDFMEKTEDLSVTLSELGTTDAVFDFEHCSVGDFGGIEALENAATFMAHEGIRVHVRNTAMSHNLMTRARPYFSHVTWAEPELGRDMTFRQISVTGEKVTGLPFPFGTAFKAEPTVKVNPEDDNEELPTRNDIVATTYMYDAEADLNVPVVILCPATDAVAPCPAIEAAPAAAEPEAATEPFAEESDSAKTSPMDLVGGLAAKAAAKVVAVVEDVVDAVRPDEAAADEVAEVEKLTRVVAWDASCEKVEEEDRARCVAFVQQSLRCHLANMAIEAAAAADAEEEEKEAEEMKGTHAHSQ